MQAIQWETEQSMFESERLALLRVLHDDKLGLERMRADMRVLREMLARENLGAMAEGVLASMERECTRMRQLYESLCESMALGEAYIEEADLCALVGWVAQAHGPMMRQAGIELAVRCSTDALVGRVDSMLLERMLANLLSNAAKHTPASGRVALNLSQEEGFATFEVRDSGCGTDVRVLPKLFGLFVSEEATPGHGIGLSNVRKIAQLHGGTIHCSSVPGEGLCVKVRIPLNL